MGQNALYADPEDYWDIYIKLKELLTTKHKKIDQQLLDNYSWINSARNITKEY